MKYQKNIYLSVCFSSLLLCSFSESVTALEDATYDTKTSLLSLPVVSIDNSAYLKLILKLVSFEPVIFELNDITSVSSHSNHSALFNSQSGALVIPEFGSDDNNYSLHLEFDPSLPDYQFKLSDVRENALFMVVDTGQSNCYSSDGGKSECEKSGQDGAYTGNKPNYTDNGDGTITDNVTHLIWQKTPDTDGDGSIDYTDQLTQSEAVLYCSDLSLANQSDWRLPDIKTLYSLIDFSGEDVSSYAGSNTSTLNPFIDTHYFDFVYGNTDAGERIIDVQYASSTLYTSTTMNGDETMFGVNMADGRIKGYGISLRGSEKTFSVQCVRDNSNYAQNNFIDNLDDTVSDMAASLMWQKNDSLVSYDWDEAINYCENNNLAGYSDWRLPNAKELQSLVDYTRSPDTSQSPAINAVFNSTAIINEAGEQDWG